MSSCDMLQIWLRLEGGSGTSFPKDGSSSGTPSCPFDVRGGGTGEPVGGEAEPPEELGLDPELVSLGLLLFEGEEGGDGEEGPDPDLENEV